MIGFLLLLEIFVELLASELFKEKNFSSFSNDFN